MKIAPLVLEHIILPSLSWARIDLDVARGAQMRCGVRWLEEGETSSAYCFRLERKDGADCWISAIKLEDGSIVSSCTEFFAGFTAFYTSLFSATPTDPALRASLLNINVCPVS